MTTFHPVDDLAEELHAGIHEHMTRQAELGWPSDVERLVWHQLDIALALLLAYLDKLDAVEPELVH